MNTSSLHSPPASARQAYLHLSLSTVALQVPANQLSMTVIEVDGSLAHFVTLPDGKLLCVNRGRDDAVAARPA